jgi:hypothetical protein
LERRPADVRFGVELLTVQQPPRAPRPALVLLGVLGGQPWRAVLDGVPGHTGSMVVAEGDSLAGLTIRAVGSDSVVVAGFDTVWVLGLRRSWR